MTSNKTSNTTSTDDHIAIQRLMYTYAKCADTRDYAGFADVFCSDAIFDYEGQRVDSLSDIQRMMRNLEVFKVTQHRVQNVLYEVVDDSATGETYCLASHVLENSDGTKKIDMAINYADALRRTDSGWRIAHRVFNVIWTHTVSLDAGS